MQPHVMRLHDVRAKTGCFAAKNKQCLTLHHLWGSENIQCWAEMPNIASVMFKE